MVLALNHENGHNIPIMRWEYEGAAKELINFKQI